MSMPKHAVILDTNTLIDNPKILFAFPDALVVIPSIVIDELDNLKDSKKVEVRRHSRIASNYIDEVTEQYEESDAEYMYLDNGGMLVIDGDYSVCFASKEPEKPDNIIISSAMRYAQKTFENETGYLFDTVTMYSNDTNVRNKTRVQARALGLKHKVKARKHSLIAESLLEIDSGVSEVFLSESDMTKCRNSKDKSISLDLPYINGEHLILKSEMSPDNNQILAQWDAIHKKAVAINDYKKGEPIWRIGQGSKGAEDVRPRDSRQLFLANDLLNTDKNLHFVLSRVAGAGKNYITTACGLRLLQDDKYDRMIVIKPMISVEGSDTGYLPGTKEEKMAPWFESFNDTMYELTLDGQGITADIEGKIELDIVTHMRGRSIPRTLMILDECQNFSPEAIKTLITRAGEDSKIVLMGDLSQIDNPRLDSDNNGLRVWAERARNLTTGYEDSTYILLDSNFRSKLSAWASSFYED